MDVTKYDRSARGKNAPLYEYYAKKIKDETGVVSGRCLDAGCGGGYLGLALAGITDLEFTFLDVSNEMLEKADAHIVEDSLEKRAKTLHADVHEIPLPDGCMDLVISRGSIPFWKDPGKALSEIYRLLASNGKAFVGGGRGTPQMRKQFERNMKKDSFAGPDGKRRRPGGPDDPWKIMKRRNFDQILKDVGISRFSAPIEADGRWIRLWK